MKNILAIASLCACVSSHAGEKKNMINILIDKMENPPAISGRIVPTTLGKTGFFWYKLEPDNAPVKHHVYDPGPAANQLIEIAKQTIKQSKKPDEPTSSQVKSKRHTNKTTTIATDSWKTTDQLIESNQHKYDLIAIEKALKWQNQPVQPKDLKLPKM